MDLRRIRSFFAVIEHRNLSHAAHALRVSQPTLSRQMQALEEEFNAALFERCGRGMIPTEAGLRLHEGLQGLERHLHALKGEIAAAASEPTGDIAFGIPPSPRGLVAIPLLTRFAKSHPRVMVRIRESTSGGLRDLVASGALDLAITNFHEATRDISVDPLGREQIMLVGPPKARLSLKRPVSLEALGDLPLVLTTHPNSLRTTVEAGLIRAGKRPQINFEANALPLMTDLVTAGLGYTVLPHSGIRDALKRKEITACPIKGFHFTWIIAKTKSKPLGLAAERFAELVHQIAREKISEGLWSRPT